MGNAAVQAAAGINASKLEHQYQPVVSQALGVDAASEARVIHVVKGATADVVAFRAGAVTPAGATTTVTVDLKKNGTTILSGVITLDNSQAAYELESAAGFTSTDLVTGDVLTVHFALTGSNEPQGCFAQLIVREDAA